MGREMVRRVARSSGFIANDPARGNQPGVPVKKVVPMLFGRPEWKLKKVASYAPKLTAVKRSPPQKRRSPSAPTAKTMAITAKKTTSQRKLRRDGTARRPRK